MNLKRHPEVFKSMRGMKLITWIEWIMHQRAFIAPEIANYSKTTKIELEPKLIIAML